MGVVNRSSGQIPGFHYFETNRRSGLTWTARTLDQYLAALNRVVPGTSVSFPGLTDANKCADRIAYLATLR
jgi:cytochrome c